MITRGPRGGRRARAGADAKAGAVGGDVREGRAPASPPGPPGKDPPHLLRLYITGTTAASARAIERARAICEQHLQGRYELEVIDIYQMPALAKDHQIVAAPTLIKVLPPPLRRFIGDLTKADQVLFGLDVLPRE